MGVIGYHTIYRLINKTNGVAFSRAKVNVIGRIRVMRLEPASFLAALRGSEKKVGHWINFSIFAKNRYLRVFRRFCTNSLFAKLSCCLMVKPKAVGNTTTISWLGLNRTLLNTDPPSGYDELQYQTALF